jgi:hypothetical protein
MESDATLQPICISSDGSCVSIFLLDASQLLLRIFPTTTAGAVCLSIKEHLGLTYDAHYGLFHYSSTDLCFRLLDDSAVLARVVSKWTQESLSSGPNHFFFKRAMWVAGSRTERDELSAELGSSASHALTFHDCVFHVVAGNYPFRTSELVLLAALLLQSIRGDHVPERDTIADIGCVPLPAFVIVLCSRIQP